MVSVFKPNAAVLKLVNDTFASAACQNFMREVLNNASSDDNPVLEGGDIQKIFAAFLAQEKGGLSREKKTEWGSAMGRIRKEGKGNGILYLRLYSTDQDWLDARSIVNELPHIAGIKGGWPREEYDDYALAVAVHKNPDYDSLFRLKGNYDPATSGLTGPKSPFAAFPDLNAVRKTKARYDARWSNYFHDILNQLCVVSH
jgi:hypothetical protein